MLQRQVSNKQISNTTNIYKYLTFEIGHLKLICHLLICLFVYFVCAYLFICLFPKKAFAQSLSLSIWPPLLEVMIQPSKTVTQVYKLTNNSDQSLQITPQIYSFRPQGETGEINIKSNLKTLRASQQSSNPNFFSFSSGEQFGKPFTIPIGETKELTLQITIPKNTSEADYYNTLLFGTALAADENSPSNSSSVTQIGTNILLTVSQTGKPDRLARIAEFSAPKIIDCLSPIHFTVRLENWGKTLWKPFGKIKITGILKQKNEIALLPQNVLAQSVRKLEVSELKPNLPLGPFRAEL